MAPHPQSMHFQFRVLLLVFAPAPIASFLLGPTALPTCSPVPESDSDMEADKGFSGFLNFNRTGTNDWGGDLEIGLKLSATNVKEVELEADSDAPSFEEDSRLAIFCRLAKLGRPR